MGADRHRSDSRAATAMRDTERLVQVEMTHVRAELARLRHPEKSVKVCAIGVDLAAGLVNDGANLLNRCLVDPVG